MPRCWLSTSSDRWHWVNLLCNVPHVHHRIFLVINISTTPENCQSLGKKCILAPGVDTYHGLILVKAITWRFVFLTILLIEISIIALIALNAKAQSVKQSTHCVKHKPINKLWTHCFHITLRCTVVLRLVHYKIGGLCNVHIVNIYHTSLYTHDTPKIDIYLTKLKTLLAHY